MGVDLTARITWCAWCAFIGLVAELQNYSAHAYMAMGGKQEMESMSRVAYQSGLGTRHPLTDHGRRVALYYTAQSYPVIKPVKYTRLCL
jgi:hypothetical protein